MKLSESNHPLDKKVWANMRSGNESIRYFCAMYVHYRSSRTSPEEAAEQALAGFDNVRERKEAEAFAGVRYWGLAYGGAFEGDEHFRR